MNRLGDARMPLLHGELKRRPDLRGQRKVDAGGHDANYGGVAIVQANGAADDGRSAPKRRRQKPSLKITTLGAPGSSSPERNARPSSGLTPRTSKSWR